MKPIEIAKKFIPPFALDIWRAYLKQYRSYKKKQNKSLYVDNKPVPWSEGYGEYKRDFIKKALSDNLLSGIFRDGRNLPSGFGAGIDERCVEYPWLFAQLRKTDGYLLDAGSILNQEFLISQPAITPDKLHIMTLAPENSCFYNKSVSYLYGDLREIPIRDNFYDNAVCLSTLEHIGCDNSLYTKDEGSVENRINDFEIAIREIKRVLKPGGSLFLSVPFGAYKHYGMFQQFDRDLLTRAVNAFGEAQAIIETFFKYNKSGWQVSPAEECADAEYVAWILENWKTGMLDAIPVEPDLAAAARAVACVHLIK